jgi:hypothetical protein
MNYITTKQGFADFVGGQFFTVCFTKVDGTERILNGRLGVRKHVRGTGNHKNNETLLIVWDCQKREYRSFHITTVQWVKAHGMKLDLAAMQVKREMVKAQAVNREIRKAA